MPAADDAVWLEVLPSFREFGPALSKGLDKPLGAEGDKAGRRLGTAMVAGMAAAMTGAVVVGKALAGVGESFANMRSKIASETGATGAELDRLSKITTDVGMRVPAAFEDIAPAVAAVKSSIGDMAGVTDKQLTDTAAAAMNFGKAFEIDVTRATQVAGQMMKNGLAKDGTQAFDMLTAAAQKVPPALREDILDAVDEYGPSFKQMGLSGEQAMGMLVKASEKGMFGIDKTGDAIKELGIRMTTADAGAKEATESMGLNYEKLAGQMAKGGEDGRKAFDTIVGSLQKIKDPAKQAETAMALFGTPLEDLNAADIPKFLDGMKTSGDAMAGYAGSSERLATSLMGPREQLQLLGNRIMVAVKPIADELFATLGRGTQWLTDVAVPALERFIGEWRAGVGAGGEFRTALEGVAAAIRGGLGWIVDNWQTVAGFAGVILGIAAAVKVYQLGLAAYNGIMLAVRVATIAWTAAQWLLNVALNANPIGLIIAGLVLLGVGLVLLWQKSETFRNIVMGAWQGIKDGAAAAVGWFTGTALPALQALWDGIVAGFRWLGGIVVGAVKGLVDGVVASFNWWRDTLLGIGRFLWDNLVGGFNWLRDTASNVVKALVDRVVGHFNWWRDTLLAIATAMTQWVVDKVTWLRDTALSVVQGMVDRAVANFYWWRDTLVKIAADASQWIIDRLNGLKDGAEGLFTRMVEGIGRIWDGLKRAASDPVRFVIDTVINRGIIKGWNDLAGLLKLDNLKIKEISVPGFARGGVLPGPGTSRGDDMVVIDRAGRPRATVASGEPVVSRAQYARNKPVVDAILAGRKLPGFFLGGVMPTPGPVRPHGLPYYGATWAGDMGYGTGSPIYAWKDGVVASTSYKNYSYGNETNINHAGQSTKYAHQSQILVKPGDVVKAGQLIGKIGDTGKAYGAHLHFEVRGGNVNQADGATGDPGGGFDPLAAAMGLVTDKLASPVKALIDKIPGAGMFVDAAKHMGTKLLDGAVEKIKSLASVVTGSDPRMSGVGADASGSIMGPLLNMVKARGLPRKVALIAGITAMQEASGRLDFTPDENSDVGPFQQRTPRDGTIAQLNDLGYALDVFLHGVRAKPGNGDGGGYHVPGLFDKPWQTMHPGAAAQAVQVSAFPSYYNKHIPTVDRMLDAMGYWRGTNSAHSGLAWVGERGPELVDFSGRERVYDAKTSKQIASGAGAPNITFAPKYEAPKSIQRDLEDFVHEAQKAGLM